MKEKKILAEKKLSHKRVSYIKIVEKSNQNLKVIKNTLPYKSGNPESLKNNHSSWRVLQLMCT